MSSWAVSRWLSTSAAHVLAQVKPYGICGEQSDTGASFLRELRFSVPIIPPTAPHSSINRSDDYQKADWLTIEILNKVSTGKFVVEKCWSSCPVFDDVSWW
jgi:hypothetical protein